MSAVSFTVSVADFAAMGDEWKALKVVARDEEARTTRVFVMARAFLIMVVGR